MIYHDSHNRALAHLTIVTWDQAAAHYYGTLHFQTGESHPQLHTAVRRKVPVTRVLTASSAAYLNREDGEGSYVAGEDSERFHSQHHVVRAAVTAVKRLQALGIQVLLCRDPTDLDPCETLIGPTYEHVNKMNGVWKKFMAEEDWEEKPEQTELIAQEWEDLLMQVIPPRMD